VPTPPAITIEAQETQDLFVTMPEAFKSLKFLGGHQVLPTFVTRISLCQSMMLKMMSSTTAAVTKALMGVFTGLEMALIKSLTVGSCMQRSCQARVKEIGMSISYELHKRDTQNHCCHQLSLLTRQL
jgi:hypothetical protein